MTEYVFHLTLIPIYEFFPGYLLLVPEWFIPVHRLETKNNYQEPVGKFLQLQSKRNDTLYVNLHKTLVADHIYVFSLTSFNCIKWLGEIFSQP